MNSNKVKAAGAHFLLSLIVITFLLGLVIYFWFPNSIIKVSNFKEIALLIISVDLVLGPLLTFIVFKPLKKGLKFDLAIIATIQVSALIFGIYNLYKVHPVYISFNVDRFTLISATEARPESATSKEFKISKLSSPKFVVSKLPDDVEKRNALILKTIRTGQSDFELKSEYYHSFEDNIQNVLEKSLDPQIIFNDKSSKEKSDEFISKHGMSLNDYAYLPLEGTSKDAILVLDNITAKPIDIIDVVPWALDLSKNQ